jgi:uncharacterized membrane protein YcfT
VVLYLIVKRLGFGVFLFERPGWARIAGDRGPIPAAAWTTAPANYKATLASSRS